MNGIAVFYKRANPADSVVQEIRLFIILPEKAEAIPSDLFQITWRTFMAEKDAGLDSFPQFFAVVPNACTRCLLSGQRRERVFVVREILLIS